jgi:hypothetical protein
MFAAMMLSYALTVSAGAERLEGLPVDLYAVDPRTGLSYPFVAHQTLEGLRAEGDGWVRFARGAGWPEPNERAAALPTMKGVVVDSALVVLAGGTPARACYVKFTSGVGRGRQAWVLDVFVHPDSRFEALDGTYNAIGQGGVWPLLGLPAGWSSVILFRMSWAAVWQF